jgi:hypothetical protein
VNAWIQERARMKPTGKTFFISEQRKPLHRWTVNLVCENLAMSPLFTRHDLNQERFSPFTSS